MIKQNFYQGQKVTPSDLNQGLSGYADGLTARLQSDILGAGLIQGFGAEIINGFVMGIGPGLAYNAKGQRLHLKQGVQVNLAAHTPAVGTKWVKIWGILEYTKTQPVIDGEGNTVYTHWEETSAFGSGDTVPEGALHFYDVQLSTGAILIINPAYPLLETPLAQSQRTRGYGYNGGNPKITAPNGFEVDLLTLATRRAVFDALKPGGYKKGDILWLEPSTYETQSTPPAGGSISYPYTVPAASAFMGKARTYSAQTDFRQYAVRLRALKDNPRNPAEAGAIGSDWAVDDPSAICEEGSNGNGEYAMRAGGNIFEKMAGQHKNQVLSVGNNLVFNYPVHLIMSPSKELEWTVLTNNHAHVIGLLSPYYQNYMGGFTTSQCTHTSAVNDGNYINSFVYLHFNSRWY